MKLFCFFILTTFIAVILADNPNANDEILRNDMEQIEGKSYKFGYETSGGTKHEEQGEVIDPNAEEPAYSVRGSYSFIGDDGVTYTVDYVADQNGFRPSGSHLPKA